MEFYKISKLSWQAGLGLWREELEKLPGTVFIATESWSFPALWRDERYEVSRFENRQKMGRWEDARLSCIRICSLIRKLKVYDFTEVSYFPEIILSLSSWLLGWKRSLMAGWTPG